MRHNHLIRGVYTVNVIDETGKQLGILNIREAIRVATEKGLDLVEVSPNSTPPTCKIMNFGQFKYEQNKNKVKQRVEVTKETGITVNTSEHDLGIKVKHVQDWLDEGHKVLVKLRFHGREIMFTKLGHDQMDRIIALLRPNSFTIENKPGLNGKLLSMLIKPTKSTQQSTAPVTKPTSN